MADPLAIALDRLEKAQMENDRLTAEVALLKQICDARASDHSFVVRENMGLGKELEVLRAENERLRAALEPDSLGKLIYDTWIKAADGPKWISFEDLAQYAPDDAVAIEAIVDEIRARAALTLDAAKEGETK